jgi:hypothetical protein
LRLRKLSVNPAGVVANFAATVAKNRVLGGSVLAGQTADKVLEHCRSPSHIISKNFDMLGLNNGFEANRKPEHVMN